MLCLNVLIVWLNSRFELTFENMCFYLHIIKTRLCVHGISLVSKDSVLCSTSVENIRVSQTFYRFVSIQPKAPANNGMLTAIIKFLIGYTWDVGPGFQFALNKDFIFRGPSEFGIRRSGQNRPLGGVLWPWNTGVRYGFAGRLAFSVLECSVAYHWSRWEQHLVFDELLVALFGYIPGGGGGTPRKFE